MRQSSISEDPDTLETASKYFWWRKSTMPLRSVSEDPATLETASRYF